MLLRYSRTGANSSASSSCCYQEVVQVQYCRRILNGDEFFSSRVIPVVFPYALVHAICLEASGKAAWAIPRLPSLRLTRRYHRHDYHIGLQSQI